MDSIPSQMNLVNTHTLYDPFILILSSYLCLGLPGAFSSVFPFLRFSYPVLISLHAPFNNVIKNQLMSRAATLGQDRCTSRREGCTDCLCVYLSRRERGGYQYVVTGHGRTRVALSQSGVRECPVFSQSCT